MNIAKKGESGGDDMKEKLDAAVQKQCAPSSLDRKAKRKPNPKMVESTAKWVGRTAEPSRFGTDGATRFGRLTRVE